MPVRRQASAMGRDVCENGPAQCRTTAGVVQCAVERCCVVQRKRHVLQAKLRRLLSHLLWITAGEDRSQASLHRQPCDQVAGIAVGTVESEMSWSWSILAGEWGVGSEAEWGVDS